MVSCFFANAQETPSSEVLTVERCIQVGLQKNDQIQLTILDMDEAVALSIQSRARTLPVAGAQLVLIPLIIFVDVRVPFYDPKAMPGIRTARVAKVAAMVNLDLVIIEFVEEVRTRYASILFLKERLKIRKEYLEILQDEIKLTQELFDAGRTQKSDITRLQVNRDFAKVSVVGLEEDINNEKLMLADVLGMTLEELQNLGEIKGEFSTSLPGAKSQQEWEALGFKNRRDLQLIKLLEEARYHQVRLAAATYYPSFTGSIFSRFELWAPDFLNELSTARDENNDTVEASRLRFRAIMDWTVLDWGETAGAKKEAKAQEMQAKIVRARLERGIPMEIHAALTSIQNANRILQNYSTDEGSLRKDFGKQADLLFKEGEISQLEDFKAQEDLLQMKEAYVTALYQLELGRIALYRSTGQLVKLKNPAPKGEVEVSP